MDPTATHAQLVDHIYTTLSTVTGLGKIHKLPRDLSDMVDIEEVFTSGNPALINAWVIQRERMDMRRRGAPSSHEYRTHNYVIRGYYQLSDELQSDNTFQRLLTEIMDAFVPRRLKSQSSGDVYIEDIENVNVRFIGIDKLADMYWVHVAEIEVVFLERISKIAYFGIGGN